MIVTQDIEMAIRYYKAVQAELAKRGNPLKALIAFSGEKEVDGIKYSEAEMEWLPPRTRPAPRFDKDEFRPPW
ncbi:MAG: hypothetical protein M5R42_21865 [Rhodocyclaceae bacterium]|nr:hypothetical protein [Rhodocyclaceae bacterium]